jgi:hypothetical protein
MELRKTTAAPSSRALAILTQEESMAHGDRRVLSVFHAAPIGGWSAGTTWRLRWCWKAST